MPSWKPKELKAFAEAAQSLKLYRRAELIDPDTERPLIEQLYVDPLPGEAVLQTMLRQSTTFLIGRKGLKIYRLSTRAARNTEAKVVDFSLYRYQDCLRVS